MEGQVDKWKTLWKLGYMLRSYEDMRLKPTKRFRAYERRINDMEMGLYVEYSHTHTGIYIYIHICMEKGLNNFQYPLGVYWSYLSNGYTRNLGPQSQYW